MSFQLREPAPVATFSGEYQNKTVTEETDDIGRIKQLASKGSMDMAKHPMEMAGLSKTLSTSLRRGDTAASRKSAWPFDFYQAYGKIPVDYKYWDRDYQAPCGPTKLRAMHAHAIADNGEQYAADQVFHRGAMREAHQRAISSFMHVEGMREVPRPRRGSAFTNLKSFFSSQRSSN